ncbi:MAG: hypothetical protein ACI4XE_10020 [Acutalibacteraceae bacterium]
MKNLKKIIAVFLCIITVFSVLSIAVYATSGSNYYTITTKACYWYPGSESITVSQSKEVYYCNKSCTKTKTRNALSCTVTCTPISWSGDKKPKTIKQSFCGSSKKIDLDKNVTYSVKITWKSVICANHYGTKQEGYAYISGMHKAKYA